MYMSLGKILRLILLMALVFTFMGLNSRQLFAAGLL